MSAGERGASGAEQSRLIAAYLDENNKLLEAIVQNQNAGRLHECIQYQLQLQQNLIYLGTHADDEPGLERVRFQRRPPPPPAEREAATAEPATAGDEQAAAETTT